MATAKKVQVVEKNPGTKIEWKQNGTKLTFGDDDLTIRCDTRQRDWPVQVDICADEDGNLVIGTGTGRYYVAQVLIPPTVYVEVPVEEAPAPISHEGTGEGEGGLVPVPQPIDMSTVVLTLWSLDGSTYKKEESDNG